MQYRRAFTPGGSYFFTLALQDRKQDLLVRYIDALRQAFAEVKTRHPFEITAVCVLPDHLHLLVKLPEHDQNYPMRLRMIKAKFSQALPKIENVSPSRRQKNERGIWQRRYWEHTVRDERDFTNHMDYIHFNPVKHGYAAAAKDWPYSTFLHCVGQGIYPMDWGGNPEADIYTD